MTSGRRLLAVLLAIVALGFGAAIAVEPDEVLKDPALEARARSISADLRCLVCQNQSIDDSNAPLARDLRLLVRERLTAGDSDAEVRRFAVERYGEFILLKPPFGTHTLLLWLTPLVVLALAAWFLLRGGFGRQAAPARDGDRSRLSPDEEAELAEVLKKDGSSP